MDESREAVVVLDDDDRVVLASRRARQTMDGIREGELAPPGLLTGERGVIPLVVPYEVDGRRERLVYLSREGDLAAYEELRSGLHGGRVARAPHAARAAAHADRDRVAARRGRHRAPRAGGGEVHQITELIDEVLFLSELESGARVVALGAEPVRPVLAEALEALEERASRAGVELRLECDPTLELAIRPRMLLVVARNLAENAIRYAGPGATFTLARDPVEDGSIELVGRDDGVGVEDAELPRLFERFYRADRARASRGTGLGLAIVKHVVTQAGGIGRGLRRDRAKGSRSAASSLPP